MPGLDLFIRGGTVVTACALRRRGAGGPEAARPRGGPVPGLDPASGFGASLL